MLTADSVKTLQPYGLTSFICKKMIAIYTTIRTYSGTLDKQNHQMVPRWYAHICDDTIYHRHHSRPKLPFFLCRHTPPHRRRLVVGEVQMLLLSAVSERVRIATACLLLTWFNWMPSARQVAFYINTHHRQKHVTPADVTAVPSLATCKIRLKTFFIWTLLPLFICSLQ